MRLSHCLLGHLTIRYLTVFPLISHRLLFPPQVLDIGTTCLDKATRDEMLSDMARCVTIKDLTIGLKSSL